jgi:hypothetical protein
VLEVLSTELARRNPKAYIAHFQRLAPEAQRAWLGQLTADEHRLHLQVLGEAVVLGLVLRVTGDGVELAVTLAGAALGQAQGWGEAKALQHGAFERAEALGGLVTATGLLRLPVEQLESAPLERLGWVVRTVTLLVDPCGGPLTWRAEGSLPCGGTFWSAAEPLSGTREAWTARLRHAAAARGAELAIVSE